MFCGKGIGGISTQTNWILQLICNARRACRYGSTLSDHLQQAGQDTAKFFGMTVVDVEGRKAVYDIYD